MTPLERMNAVRDLRAKGVGATAKAVLFVLVARADADGWSYPSVALIAADACVGPTAARAALRELERLGVLRVERRVRETHRFQIVDAALRNPNPRNVDPPESGPSAFRSVTLRNPSFDPSESEAEGDQLTDQEGDHFALRAPEPKKAARAVRKKRAPAPDTPAGFADLVAHYCAAFETSRGVKPAFTSRHGRAVKQLLAQFSLEESKAMVDAAFAKGKYFSGELWTIANSPNAYRGNARTSGELRQTAPSQVVDSWMADGIRKAESEVVGR